LIESEKSEGKHNWINRVRYLEDQKQFAVMIAKSQDPNFNPWVKYEKEKSYATYVLEKAKKYETFFGKITNSKRF
jgi:hypothetical protein